MTLTTGMLMDGKMSVGVRNRTNGVNNNSSRAATTNVYGRRKARRTIHISFSCVQFSRNNGRHFRGVFPSFSLLGFFLQSTAHAPQKNPHVGQNAEHDAQALE